MYQDLIYIFKRISLFLSGKVSTGREIGKMKVNYRSLGDTGSFPASGRSLGDPGHGNPLQYSCLENLMDRGAWQATVPGVSKSQTRLSD